MLALRIRQDSPEVIAGRILVAAAVVVVSKQVAVSVASQRATLVVTRQEATLVVTRQAEAAFKALVASRKRWIGGTIRSVGRPFPFIEKQHSVGSHHMLYSMRFDALLHIRIYNFQLYGIDSSSR
jgi:hypothetical protein